jgi:ribonucleoside-diphosphate reductase alpha chain
MVSALSPVERNGEIAGPLKGIGGSRSHGFGAARVRSLPDAVAQALERNYLASDSVAKELTDLCPSCGEATLVHQEGCARCRNCDYSQC